MPALSRQLKILILISLLVVLTGVAILLVLLMTEDSVVQIVLIALILLLWPLGIWFNHYRKQRAAKAAAQTDETEPATIEQPATNRPSREYDNLTSGAAEVTNFLRQNRPWGEQGGDAIYGLPWFLIAGPPGSGKTSLLLSAGLSFNALESQRRADQNLLRATRDCDWRVTDDAVMLDTSGRYQNEGGDRDEWLGLIEALKKFRKRRSLDGMVIVVNAASLLAMQSTAEIEQHAQILRARLNEVMTGAGMQFPVYLVFTHADLIGGFGDFFRALGPDERAQVWGATIPLAQSEKAHALFDSEFDYLLDSLFRRRLLRLSGSGSPKEQLGVFDFPLHFNAARQKLGDFILALFRPNPFSKLPLLRGIYFTCSPALQSKSDGREEDGPARDVRITNKGFFTEDLFKKVLLRDKNIAAAMQVTETRPSRTRRLAIAAAALCALCSLFAVGMIISFFNNRSLIEDGQRAGADVLRHFRAVNTSLSSSPAPSNLTAIEAEDFGKLQEMLMRLDDYDDSWSQSLFYRFGLYSGRQLKPRLREIYFDFVSQRLLNPALDRLAGQLREKSATLPAGAKQEEIDAAEQAYYDQLKAYKMVELQERIEEVFLRQELSAYWIELSPTGEKRHLAYYAEQARLYEDDDESVPRPQADNTLVTQARDKLKGYAAAKQVYNEIITDIGKQGQPYYLRDVVQGQQGSQWMEDVSSPSVPYVFTKQAYYKHVKGDGWVSAYQEVRSKSQNDWVLDRTFDYQRVEPESLRKRYESDYITAWQKFIDSLRVKEFKKKSDAVEALDSFSQPNSPFETIVREVGIQTKLSEPPSSGGMIAWLKSWLTPKSRADTAVEKSFATLNSFKPDEYFRRLKEVRDRLRDAPGEEWSQVASLANDERFKKARDEARELLKQLKATPGSAAVATLLGRPLDNIDSALGLGVKTDLELAWRNLRQTAKRFESSYPFSPSSNSSVFPSELESFLNPVNGNLTVFFNQYLKGSFDNSSGHLRPLSPGDFSDQFVAYLINMFRVRDALFPPGSQRAGFQYSINLQAPQGQDVELVIDGRSHKAPATVTADWPSSSGVNTGIKVNIIQAGGQAGGSQTIAQHDGPWGCFKMVAAGQAAGGSLYRFNWPGGVRATLQAPVNNNPFQIDFSQMRAPDRVGQ